MAKMTITEFAAVINDDFEQYRYFWVCAAMREQTHFWAEPKHRALLRPEVQRILDYYNEHKEEQKQWSSKRTKQPESI